MRVLVCGGRNYGRKQKGKLWVENEEETKYLYDCLNQVQTDLIINGAAKGADRLSSKYAEEKKITCLMYPALWDKEGKAAGILRNIRMLEESQPHLVVAFAGGKGTDHMMTIAAATGVPVWNTTLSPSFMVEEPTGAPQGR